jgi:hypothetical protein
MVMQKTACYKTSCFVQEPCVQIPARVLTALQIYCNSKNGINIRVQFIPILEYEKRASAVS